MACAGTRYTSLAVRSFLDHGANVGIRDGEDRTVLYLLAYGSVASTPIGTSLLES